MLEGLVTWVLNNYLGKYVENLNTDQLSIALLQGAVELENLPLRKDSLRQVGLPIEVRAGFIGKIKLKIPVSQIRSAPWEISIEKLYLVAGPVRLSDWDEESEEQASHVYKLSLLDAIEASWRAETDTTPEYSYYASSYSSWLNYGTSLVTNIVENLQLTVTDVHLRYEDDITVPGSKIALGIRVESLTAQSCDNTWTPKFLSNDSSGSSFKILQLSDLGVYLDTVTDDQLWGDLSISELAAAMGQKSSPSVKHDYILVPVSGKAQVKRNLSEHPLRSRVHPRIVCDLNFEEVQLSLSDVQYGQIVNCVKGLDYIQLSQRYRKHRPSCTVREDPRAWWKYAMTCVASPKTTWNIVLEKAKENVAYVEIYTRLLSNHTASSPLSPEKKQLKEKVEWERSFDELRALREVAMFKVRPPVVNKRDTDSHSQGRSILVSWFPQWWGWYSASSAPAPQQQGEAVAPTTAATVSSEKVLTTAALEDEILDALADSVENNTLLKRDTVFGQFNFVLKRGTFNLCQQNPNRQSIMELQFENVQLGVESRPRTGSHCFHMTLGAVSLRDHLTVDSCFPVLISPQNSESAPSGRSARNLPPGLARLLSQEPSGSKAQPLFQLCYEYKPFNSNTDYRLQIHSESLDVVYNPTAVRWLIEFFTKPHQSSDPNFRAAARLGYNVVKQRTKQELLRNWDNILQGHLNSRKIWDVDLAISAPQIFLVEHFNDKNSVLCVVDFGRLHFTNREQEAAPVKQDNTKINMIDSDDDNDDDDDEEAFQTPCSTPPGSEASADSDEIINSSLDNTFDRNGSISELALHHKLYDRYSVELCDLQILVGKVRDNWKFAHLKGTSTLHVLDRFNILLQVERRIVYTSDPQFPNLTLSGNLPKLVVHVNEQKIQALRTLLDVISGKGLPSPFRSVDESPSDDVVDMAQFDREGEDVHYSEHSDNGCAKLLMLQFCVDQMAFEVQSRGRSVAELQVSGVKMSFTKRPFDTSLSLSVHGLLLVDALQTFGPDFELLLASHKHVGMDSVSGSLRDSEPTSPTSPGSPDPVCGRALRAVAGTSPSAITHALSALTIAQEPHRAKSPINMCPSSPPPNLSLGYGPWPPPASLNLDMPNSEALITVEFVFVSANCPTNVDSSENLQIANIQFNNLDIIANQETIVELIGFVKRVFPQHKTVPKTVHQSINCNGDGDTEGIATEDISGANTVPSATAPPVTTRVQLMFDFHRLNILLLRAVLKDNVIIGRKIATATMSQAKISATVGKELVIEGSLGGLQILDLTPEGQTHQRILSLGQDPLTETAHSHIDIMACLSADLYSMPGVSYPLRKQEIPSEKEAFSFNLKRNLQSDADVAYISVRFASVWYTHSPRLLCELQSCATEFKQYLANLARSIGSAATEMAIGLVHARAESLAQSLSINLYGSSSDIASTPRKRRRSWTQSLEHLESGQTTGRGTSTPFSPVDDIDTRTRIQWDVILDTPVVVLPRSANSEQVLVAHLGRMSLTNSLDIPNVPSWGDEQELTEHYDVEIRDMNVYTLDMQVRTCNTHSGSDCPLLRVDKLYDCKERGKPVLHNTVIQLAIEREMGKLKMRQNEEILLESGPDFTSAERQDTIQINGEVVTPLKVSLSRQQYEQVLETVSSVLADNTSPDIGGESTVQSGQGSRQLMNIEEDTELHTGVSTLNLDPALRARMLLRKPHQPVTTPHHSLILKVLFDLPVFTVELKADFGFGEQSLVDLSFRDLQVQYDRSHHLETNIQMSLKSLVMEDLLQLPDSKYRCIMNSSFPPSGPSAAMSSFVSKSCPNLSPFLHHHHHHMPDVHASLPDRLEAETVFGATVKKSKNIQAEMPKRVKKTSETIYPTTPPPSPRQESPPDVFKEDNLVHINVVLRAPRHHGMNSSRFVSIDFNSLDVIANVESWVVVLDFFGISSTEPDVQNEDTTKEPIAKKQQATQVEQTPMNSEFEISVRSLSLVLNRKDYEVARANMSQLNAHITTIGGSGVTDTEASVGSFSLSDLTPLHSQLYREKFITAGLNLVMTKYNSVDFNRSREVDVCLKMEMTSVLYVHTQRFVAELQAFFRHFSQLQKLLGSIRSARKMSDFDGPSMRIKLELHAASPVILLPLSSRSLEVLIADLGRLCVSNRFLMSGSEGTISFVQDTSKEVLLEVMNIQLDNMDLLTGERCTDMTENCINLGSYCVQRRLGSLLREKCQLQLKIERNLMTHISHNVVPDMSVMGTLSTLAASINLAQYRLIRGLLTYNIGEYLDDVHLQDNSSSQNNLHQDENSHVNVWISMSISLELVDVSVCLQPNPDLTLACVNFVKSHLVVESFSDHTQDIDLVSQEILITDTRFINKPANKRSNVFTNILQPIVMSSEAATVQAQVHHRRLLDLSKFTILLNNMRLMAILDWWEAVRDFIMESPNNPVPDGVVRDITKQISTPVQIPFEMKLNITDSEIVFVEDTSQWDTNAVILKSTTVITYRPLFSEKPVSCNLNHCEMFSCILGMEDETALSIIDPVTVNIEIVKVSSATEDIKILKVQMVRLSLRLSYNDVRMFSQMLKSLPKQTQWARSHSVEAVEDTKPANFRITEQIKTLSALGFQLNDCNEALRQCNGQLDDAALWLTQNAIPLSVVTYGSGAEAERAFTRLEVVTDCLSVCVIDDCRDADVPLIELTMANLTLKQDIVGGSGTANCYLSSDYYNRLLSGWEPFLEPWTCQLQWEHSFGASRLQTFVTSKDPLNINITSTLVELYSNVKENWTQDYYNPKDRSDAVTSSKTLGSPPGYRRRSPFVPFALKNDTGSRLWFTTITTSNDYFAEPSFNKSPSPSDTRENWISVDSGDTVPFSFEERDKMRHRDTHKLQTHKLGVRVEGWHKIDPVSVDRVGIYFRQASPDYNSGSLDLPQARIVLEVTLEGSARKLVTVRSALQLSNQLVDTVEVKLDNTHIYSGGHPTHLIIGPGATLSVPLSYALAQIWVRPLDRTQMLTHYHAFCNRPLAWQHVTRSGQIAEELRQCHSNRGINYRFTAAVRRENYPFDRPPPLAPPLHNMWLQPAHTITLLSALTIVNLLPHELAYSIKDITKGRIKPGQQAAIHEVSQESSIELSLHLENYPGCGGITVPSFTNNFTARLRVHDHTNRRLYLQAAILAQPGSGLRVLVSAPFWLVNKTALPLVFRQEGVAIETAGQFEEHEVARMVAPLLFSFADQDASPTVVARVGNRVHPDGVPQWCQHFSLVPGIQVRRLRVSLRENRPDVVYMMGIDIRSGRGRYRATNIVTLSAHYQIHNKSSYRIQFAQRCFASTVSDPGAQATYLQAVPDCSLAFHWPRLDKDQLLCLRLMDVPQCQWSGGFLINNNDSFHLNVRDLNGHMYFLRVEIVLQRATYFIVITDADSMPAPIRIDNFSQVAIQFYQTNVQVISTVRAHSSVPYALDEPNKAQCITLMAPGGVCATYDINKLGEGPGLTYENFIYIAFTATFRREGGSGDADDPLDVQSQQLVLDVPDSSGRVVLSRKQFGARSQLWRMTSEGQLQHEGSSPPKAPQDKILVLDISTPAPQPSQYVNLILRRPDKRRTSTQTWRFTEDGRLCCVHNNMCVQAKDGFFGLRRGSEAVLGPPQPVCYQVTEQGIPFEQAVTRQRLRPGSGFLAVRVLTDGPTRVLQISDVRDSRMVAILEENDWVHIAVNQRPKLLTDDSTIASPKECKECQLTVELPCIGISVVSRQPPEELLYIKLGEFQLSAMWTPEAELLDAFVRDIQIDNQLFEAQCPVLLYVTPMSRSTDPEEAARPALQITAERVPRPKNSNAEIVKHLVVKVKNMSLNIEERLMLKLFAYVGYGIKEEQEDVDESDFETQRILAEATSVHAKRYYFGSLKLIFCQVRLSVMTSNKLGENLLAVKRKLGLTLIKFEDAAVELEPFCKQHVFENSQFLFSSILKHYKDELKWQAAIILGSVDFLGNPLGFVNDISEGMSGLIYEGNVGALVKNVTHGISNSAAKVTESLSDGLGRVILDDEHEEIRRRIRGTRSGTSGEHLVAGLKGLGFGLLGGVTSVFKQTYEGASNEGFPGFISGLGKGIVGTVTKPVVGVLDLASETASAVRDSSRRSNRQAPSRSRLPRCVTSPSGLLPTYNRKQSQGQEFLYRINSRRYSELFMAYEVLRGGIDDLRIVISSEMVRVFTCASNNACAPVIETHLSDLLSCQPVSLQDMESTLHYIELTMRVDIASRVVTQDAVKRPRVRCDSRSIANWVSQQVNHARAMYIEHQHTLQTTSYGIED